MIWIVLGKMLNKISYNEDEKDSDYSHFIANVDSYCLLFISYTTKFLASL